MVCKYAMRWEIALLLLAITDTSAIYGQETKATIYDLRALAHGDEIRLLFNASSSEDQLLIYRSGQPMLDAADLDEATLVATIPSDTNFFSDYPPPEQLWYYSVIYQTTRDANQQLQLVAGNNTTRRPIWVTSLPQFEQYSPDLIPDLDPNVLILPLVDLSILNQLDDSQPIELSPIEEDYKPQEITGDGEGLQLTIFAEDQQGSSKVHLQLIEILQGPFWNGQWTRAENDLQQMLLMALSASLEQRIHFYLGQIYYFRGEWRSAILELLLTGEQYANQSRPWIDAAILRLSSE